MNGAASMTTQCSGLKVRCAKSIAMCLSAQAVERVRIYLEIGWVHYRRGNLDEAQHWRLRALEISEGLDYYAEMGSAYNGLGRAPQPQGRLERCN